MRRSGKSARLFEFAALPGSRRAKAWKSGRAIWQRMSERLWANNLEPRYKRVLLKLSGEVLMGEQTFGIDHEFVRRIAAEIKDIHSEGVQIGIVIGGGN